MKTQRDTRRRVSGYSRGMLAGSVMAILAVAAGLPSAQAQEGNPYVTAAKYTYEIGKWWYENYKAAEAERNNVKLESNDRPEIVPDGPLRVSENNRARLPNVKAYTTCAWVPYAGQTTRITGEWRVNGVPVSTNTYSFTGYPSESDWDWWYSDRGAYPYSGKFSNSNPVITFDMIADGEGFNEGYNSISVRLFGSTMVEKNMWNPANWFGSPVEKKDFDETITQTKDFEVQVPYKVWKNPKVDRIEMDHQFDATVELWDQNLALKSRKGNNQNYIKPTVTTEQADGVIPPDDGTSNSEKRVAFDRRTHPGEPHPNDIHLPDFDPIKVTVVHKEWDLPELAGVEYRRDLKLRKTEPWCLGSGQVPPPDNGTPSIPKDQGSYYFTPEHTLQGGAYVALDKGVHAPVPATMTIFKLNGTSGMVPYDTLVAAVDGSFYAAGLLDPGCVYLAELSYHDNFGRRFAAQRQFQTTIDIEHPDPLLQLGEIALLPAGQDQEPGTVHQVDIVAFDIAGLAFGRILPAGNVHISLFSESGEQTLEADSLGRVSTDVPAGMQLNIGTLPDSRYRPLLVNAPTPPITKSMTVKGSGENLRDDRIALYLSPAFTDSEIHLVHSGIDGDEMTVQFVSSMNLENCESIMLYCAATGAPVGEAMPLPWGNAGQLFDYQPLKVDFHGMVSGCDAATLQDAGIKVVMAMKGGETHRTIIPVQSVKSVEESATTDGTAITGESGVSLSTATPNPAVESATILFSLPHRMPVVLSMYDALGREVAVIEQGNFGAGTYQRTVDVSGLESGIYMYRLQAGSEVRTGQMTVVR